MTFSDSPFPLAQSIEFEVGETFGIRASVDEDDTCYESGDALIEVHDLDKTLRRRAYVDVVVTIPTSSNMVEDTSLTILIHSMLSLLVYYPPLPLSVVICHLLVIMMHLRGV